MKFLVIGLGSMGKRRIRLIKENYPQIEIIGVDSKESRRLEVENLYSIKTESDLEKAKSIPEIKGALICTSPISHGKIINELLKSGINVFTEINLVKDYYEENIKLSKEKGLTLFLSSTMIYRKELEYIKNEIEDKNEKLMYRYHVGQYLPDWHPWENYKDFFVGDKRTNGCREIFAIELPWIIKTFGKVKNIKVTKDKISSLELDYEDSYIVILEHEKGHKGVMNCDIVSRKAIRNLEIYSENSHIFWEGRPETLKVLDIETKEIKDINTYENINQDNRYASNIIENVYLEEIDIFIDLLNKKEDRSKYNFEDDLHTLNLIDEIEA